MSNKEKKSDDWPPIIFVLIVLPIAYTYLGFWFTLPILIIGLAVLGWSKRHDGPFPTNSPKNNE